MDKESVIEFFGVIGVPSHELKISDGWVNCRCLLASMTHPSGRDSRPSAGISYNSRGPSFYSCFGCSQGQVHNLYELLFLLWLADGVYEWEAADFLLYHEIEAIRDAVAPTRADKWAQFAEDSAPKPIPPSVLKRFPLLSRAHVCSEYLLSRGISYEAAERYGVRVHKEYPLLIFPYTDAQAVPYVMLARNIERKSMFMVNEKLAPSLHKFATFRDIGVWFGYHHIDWSKPVLLVEGALDLLRLATLGVSNVIASSGSSVTLCQLRTLHAPSYVLGFDADVPGNRATAFSQSTLGAERCHILRWDTVACKDPGELKDEGQLRSAIEASGMCSDIFFVAC